MDHVAVMGVDLAKSVFQLHEVDAEGKVGLRRRLSRSKFPSFFAALRRCLRHAKLIDLLEAANPALRDRPRRVIYPA